MINYNCSSSAVSSNTRSSLKPDSLCSTSVQGLHCLCLCAEYAILQTQKAHLTYDSIMRLHHIPIPSDREGLFSIRDDHCSLTEQQPDQLF